MQRCECAANTVSQGQAMLSGLRLISCSLWPRLYAVLLDGQVMAVRSKLEQIAWVWALIFAFAAPELFTFLRALRITMFKRERRPSGLEVTLVSNVFGYLLCLP